jgi:hypothetical protein
VKQIKETRFRQRLVAAISEFFAHRKGSLLDHLDQAQGTIPLAYETGLFEVYYLPHFAENKYGVYFKDTGEFGVHSSFYDDSRDKTYNSYYRSDRKFEAENYLDCLRIDEQI